MEIRRRIASVAVVLALSFAGPAAAGTASFSLTAGALLGDTGATVSPGGVVLPNANAPQAFFSFILPRDYAPDTPVTLVVGLHSIATSCTFVLVPSVVVQRRPGIPIDGEVGVLAEKNGSQVVTAPASSTIPFQKVYVLSTGGTIPGMKKGDQFLIAIVRNPGDPDDTCGNDVYFESVDVRYTTP
ncbi:MAG TPA: hypothetical protein VFD92_02215 [Candidatus Binatia bacterium]|nr:hypothetical protein [Candidatus Binatia bacterium]